MQYILQYWISEFYNIFYSIGSVCFICFNRFDLENKIKVLNRNAVEFFNKGYLARLRKNKNYNINLGKGKFFELILG